VQFSEVQKLSDLELDLGLGLSHIGVHVRSRSAYTKFDGNRKNLRTERPKFQIIRSSLGDDLKMYLLSEMIFMRTNLRSISLMLDWFVNTVRTLSLSRRG